MPSGRGGEGSSSGQAYGRMRSSSSGQAHSGHRGGSSYTRTTRSQKGHSDSRMAGGPSISCGICGSAFGGSGLTEIVGGTGPFLDQDASHAGSPSGFGEASENRRHRTTLCGLHLFLAAPLPARHIGVHGLMLPTVVPLVVDRELRVAPVGPADAAGTVGVVRPRDLADAGSAVGA